MDKKKNTKCVRQLKGPQIEQVFCALKSSIEPRCELNFTSAFELLVAVVLSAQATDVSVNVATAKLYPVRNTAEGILRLGEDGLVEYIRSIGLYRTKAKHIIALCERLVADYHGEVPEDFDKLVALPGVGRKSANVVLNVWFHHPTIPVDTHVFRVATRLGLTRERTPEATEMALLKRVPQAYLLDAHHLLLLHGRYTCTARLPKCTDCVLASLCPSCAKAGGSVQ